MNKKLNTYIKQVLAVLSFFAGVVFGLLGVFIIPKGVIDGSVLIMCAQLFFLSATFLGLNVHFDLTKKKFSTEDPNDDDKTDEDNNLQN